MNEQDFLKNFAKILGAEQTFEEIEEKQQRERLMLERLSVQFGVPIAEEVVREVPKELLNQPVAEPEPIIEEVIEPEPIVEELVVENVIPIMPQLPVDTIITKSVEKISKAVPEKVQQAVDDIPGALRREIDSLKKSVADFHRFASRISQMGGGGAGDVISLDHQTTTIYTNHVIGRHDYYVGVGATPSTITLPALAKDGRMIIIKDEVGNCSSNPITVLGNVDNDPGGFILAENNGGIQMIFNNGGWRII
jgi:hypothetical protein